MMRHAVARHLAKLVAVLILVSVTTFVLLETIPGDRLASVLPEAQHRRCVRLPKSGSV